MKSHQTIESLKHRRALYNTLIFFFVTAVVWLAFSIVRSQTLTKLPDNIQLLAIPLNPNIDLTVVSRIEAKRKVDTATLTPDTATQENGGKSQTGDDMQVGAGEAGQVGAEAGQVGAGEAGQVGAEAGPTGFGEINSSQSELDQTIPDQNLSGQP